MSQLGWADGVRRYTSNISGNWIGLFGALCRTDMTLNVYEVAKVRSENNTSSVTDQSFICSLAERIYSLTDRGSERRVTAQETGLVNGQHNLHCFSE